MVYIKTKKTNCKEKNIKKSNKQKPFQETEGLIIWIDFNWGQSMVFCI